MTAADPRRQLGTAGEELATQKLLQGGLTIVERNWRCHEGEIDIIAQELAPDFVNSGTPSAWLVLVEVRTRRGSAFGTALESITQRKARKMRAVAHCYVQEHGWHGPWRIDVVGVQMDSQGHLLTVDHVRNAVGDE